MKTYTIPVYMVKRLRTEAEKLIDGGKTNLDIGTGLGIEYALKFFPDDRKFNIKEVT